jgi:hypothetical protein
MNNITKRQRTIMNTRPTATFKVFSDPTSDKFFPYLRTVYAPNLTKIDTIELTYMGHQWIQTDGPNIDKIKDSFNAHEFVSRLRNVPYTVCFGGEIYIFNKNNEQILAMTGLPYYD